MRKWKRKPQEQDGRFQFSGTFIVTQKVASNLNPVEIANIYFDIQVLVSLKGGMDYFQVYENESGDKLYFIDQGDPDMTADESCREEINYCTLLFSDEY